MKVTVFDINENVVGLHKKSKDLATVEFLQIIYPSMSDIRNPWPKKESY